MCNRRIALGGLVVVACLVPSPAEAQDRAIQLYDEFLRVSETLTEDCSAENLMNHIRAAELLFAYMELSAHRDLSMTGALDWMEGQATRSECLQPVFQADVSGRRGEPATGAARSGRVAADAPSQRVPAMPELSDTPRGAALVPRSELLDAQRRIQDLERDLDGEQRAVLRLRGEVEGLRQSGGGDPMDPHGCWLVDGGRSLNSYLCLFRDPTPLGLMVDFDQRAERVTVWAGSYTIEGSSLTFEAESATGERLHTSLRVRSDGRLDGMVGRGTSQEMAYLQSVGVRAR